MALTLEELCAGTEKEYGMKLIAGKNGTDNMVRWVHYIEGGETPRFLHGYELIFTTGMENQYSTWLLKFAEKLHEYGACGLVINIGPYVGDVPEDVREYCDKVSLPLYTIPWETRIVDITYEMCHHIVTDEKQSRSVAESVIYAINNPMKKEDCAAELENAGFSDSVPMEVAAVKITGMPGKTETAERRVKYEAIRRLNKYTEKHSVFTMDAFAVIVCQGVRSDDFESEVRDLAEGSEEVCAATSEVMGFDLSAAFGRARDTAKITASRKEKFNRYADMGYYKILMAADRESLRDYCRECLDALKEHDEKNGTDYVETLRLYLENNSSVTAVAELTFVHRNTVNYKIKKIKEILGCELDQSDKLRLMLAFGAERLLA